MIFKKRKNGNSGYEQEKKIPVVLDINILAENDGIRVMPIPEEVEIPDILSEYYVLVWMGSATGNIVVDFESRKIENDSWIFISPGAMFGMRAFQVNGILIVFNNKFTGRRAKSRLYLRNHPLLHQNWVFPVICPEGLDKTNMDIIMKLMNQEFRRPDKSLDVVRSYLNVLLEIAGRSFTGTAQNGDGYDERVIDLRQLIEDHYQTEHDTAFYASGIELTPKRANEILKEHTGKTITETLHNRLNLEMKRRIACTDEPVSRIGKELGFADPSYFSRFFRKNNGVTPQQFRSEFETPKPKPIPEEESNDFKFKFG